MIPVTKSQQLYNELKNKFQEGYYKPGSQLPREIDLAEELNVSRKTLRFALDQLARENLIVRMKRKGTFVKAVDSSQNKILIITNENQDFSNPYPYIMSGILKAVEAVNLQMESCTISSLTWRSVEDGIRSIRSNNPDGIICMANNMSGNESLTKVLQGSGIPVLLPHAAFSDHANTGFATLVMDYPKILLDGLRYLKILGHSRIAILWSKNSGRGITEEGYRKILRNGGMKDDSAYIGYVAYDYEAIAAWLDQLLCSVKLPLAIFCYSDFWAIHVYQYLMKKNIKIPDQISVLSIGGHIGCNYLSPTLSAIDFELSDIGAKAVNLLVDIMYDKKYASREMPEVICSHHIIERESTRYIASKQTSSKKELQLV